MLWSFCGIQPSRHGGTWSWSGSQCSPPAPDASGDIEISVPTWIRTHFKFNISVSLYSLSILSRSLSLSFYSFYKLYISIYSFVYCNIILLYIHIYICCERIKRNLSSHLWPCPNARRSASAHPSDQHALKHPLWAVGGWATQLVLFKHENMINTEMYCNQNTWELIWGYNRYRLSSLLTWWFCHPSEEYHTWSVGIIIRMGCCWRNMAIMEQW